MTPHTSSCQKVKRLSFQNPSQSRNVTVPGTAGKRHCNCLFCQLSKHSHTTYTDTRTHSEHRSKSPSTHFRENRGRLGRNKLVKHSHEVWPPTGLSVAGRDHRKHSKPHGAAGGRTELEACAAAARICDCMQGAARTAKFGSCNTATAGSVTDQPSQ